MLTECGVYYYRPEFCVDGMSCLLLQGIVTCRWNVVFAVAGSRYVSLECCVCCCRVCRRYSMDVIAAAAFGIDVDAIHNPDVEFEKHAGQIINPSKLSIVLMSE